MAKKGLFRHGELHLVVLALLERQPMHGYQLMGDLARLFAPDYRPSPGSVYPCIEALADADLIEGVDEGGRRVYQLTAAGSEALTRRSHELAEIEARTGVRVGGSGDVEEALERFAARVRAAAPLHELATVQEFLETAAAEIEQLGRGDAHVKKSKGRVR